MSSRYLPRSYTTIAAARQARVAGPYRSSRADRFRDQPAAVRRARITAAAAKRQRRRLRNMENFFALIVAG